MIALLLIAASAATTGACWLWASGDHALAVFAAGVAFTCLLRGMLYDDAS